MNTDKIAMTSRPLRPTPDAAGADLAEHHVAERHRAAERREAVVHRVDRAVGRAGGRRRPQARGRRAEADLLALHVPAAVVAVTAWLPPEAVIWGLPFPSKTIAITDMASQTTNMMANTA